MLRPIFDARPSLISIISVNALSLSRKSACVPEPERRSTIGGTVTDGRLHAASSFLRLRPKKAQPFQRVPAISEAI